jgi:hypothetical protein
MKSVVTSLIAATVFCFAAGLPSAVSAVPPGHVSKGPDDEPFGAWQARVRWVHVHTDPRSGMTYTYTYMDIVGPSQQSCDQQLQAVTASPGVSVVEFCHPV